jgi:phage terminase large subunit-like protein
MGSPEKTERMSYVSASEAYVSDVLSGKIPACKWVKLACKRHKRDLKASKDEGFAYYFSEKDAERVCKFAEMLPHVKGKWARTKETMRLEPWQCFVLCSIFGWLRKSNNKRRFRKARLYIPRKNGKSFFAAAIGLYMLALDDEPGAEVYSGATTERQAWEVFKPARMMCAQNPRMCQALGITVNAGNLLLPRDASVFKPVVRDPGDGASPHCSLTDEYHEHDTSHLLDTMETGMGAREQPLSLVISTAGNNLAGPCRDDWKACERILEGTDGFQDDSTFCVIWTIDQDDDWDNEKALIKANPNWGVSINPEGILDELKVARRDPRKQAAFKTKYLNLWVTSKEGFFNVQQWQKLADPSIKPEDFKEFDCYLAGDLASKHDLVALMQLFCLDDGRFALFGTYYLPEETLNLPENQHYRNWKMAGWIKEAGESVTDLEAFKDDVLEKLHDFQVVEMPSDPNRAWGVFPALEREGVPIVEYRNTVLTMSEPMKFLDALIRDGKIIHNGDPVLEWAISNVTAKLDNKDNVYPNKERPENKIDPVVAALFAIGRAMTREPAGSGPMFVW